MSAPKNRPGNSKNRLLLNRTLSGAVDPLLTFDVPEADIAKAVQG